MKISRRHLLVAGGSIAMIAIVDKASSSPAQSATSQSTLGANARQAMIDIFRKKDPTVVDRYFDESFVQHDPNLADGLAGMKSFAAEVASSPAADITIYRTLVDEDFFCCIPDTPASDVTAPRRSRSTCFASRAARSLSIGEGRSRRRLLICRVARKSTVRLRSLIVRRRRPIGPWYGPTGRQSWSPCASTASKSLLKALTMRSMPLKSQMALPG
jgi:hypothetical protein